MARPGFTVTQQDAAPPRGAATDTGVWFVAETAERGPVGIAVPVRSLSALVAIFGERTSYSRLHDAVAQAFRRGASVVYVVRIVGPAAAKASVDLENASGDDTLKVSASGPGDYANGWEVGVTVNGSTFTIAVTDAVGAPLATSPALASNEEAVAWGNRSDVVDVEELAAAGPPKAVSGATLAGGADDRASITDTHRTAALATFTRDLGPGQVSIPGASTVDVHTALLNHAEANRRFAILDAPAGATKAALKTHASTVRNAVSKTTARHGMLVAGSFLVPGPISGATVEVPYSAFQAGAIAAVDALGNPNVAAAGEVNGYIDVVGATYVPSEADREELAAAGVNTCKVDTNGNVFLYGFRTLADPLTDPDHWQASNVRLDMAVVARAENIAARYVFAQLDGKRETIAKFYGELVSMLSDLYRAGALFGESVDDAFRVDVGPAVNTPESIRDGRLRAVLAIRRSPFAELVEVEVVKAAITAAL